MGALADYDAYAKGLQSYYGGYGIFYTSSPGTSSATNPSSQWTMSPNAGSTPSTAAALSGTSTGARLLSRTYKAPSSVERWLARISAQHYFNGGGVAEGLLIDRLSHQGGLSGTVTTAQTTNLPTAALTRYTSGVGVMIGLEIYTQIGTTATTVTVSYTNQAGTSGRTSLARVFGGTNFREVNRIMPIPLADGDTGARSVESVTVLATTGTAGNFGVTLYKPLVVLPPLAAAQNGDCDMPFQWDLLAGGRMLKLEGDPCFQFFYHAVSTGSGGMCLGELGILEA